MMETNKSGDSVEQNLSKNRTSGLKLVLASILLAVIAVASDRFVLSPVLSNVFKQEEKSEQGVQFVQNGGVDEEIVSLFVNYDEDLDGVINLAEFVQVGNRILNREVSKHGFLLDCEAPEQHGNFVSSMRHSFPFMFAWGIRNNLERR